MHFAFTDDQKMFRDTVRNILQRECTPSVVREAWAAKRELTDAVWKTLADAGVIGMTADEDAGGMALSEVELVLPLDEVGYAAMPGPFSDTVAVAIPLLQALGTDEQKETWLRTAALGQKKIGVVWDGELLAHASMCDAVIVVRDDAACCVPRATCALHVQKSVDRARDVVRIEWSPTEEHRLRDAAGSEELLLARERATWAASAQLVGLSRRMLDMAVQYAKDREQFGRPIGAQQAIKHRLANALIVQEFARPLVYRAAWSLAHRAPDLPVDVSLAKIYAGRAARIVAKAALQVHGAIGYTTEYDLHMWMKRAWALAGSCGDEGFHRERIGSHIV